MKDYTVKIVCPSCSKKIGVGWKFCAFCGEYVDNSKPKVELRYLDGRKGDYNQKEKNAHFKMPSRFKQVSEKIKDSISEKIDKGEEVSDNTLSFFTFVITKDGVEIKELDEIVNDLQNSSIQKDYLGYYLQSESEDIYVNNVKIEVGKKHYLTNRDTLRQGETIYIFSLMNQKDVEWQQEEITLQIADKISDSFEVFDDEILYLIQNGNHIFLNNSIPQDKIRLKNYDLVSIHHRLFLVYGNQLIFQNELTEEQEKSIAENINSISDDTRLSVSIQKRLAGEKLLLSDIDFSVSSGEIVLILGGSGAGKTTLINAIMGIEKADAEILLGNINIYNQFDKVKRMIANVPQFSLHREKDSVYMTLKNAAEMKLVRDFTKDKSLLEDKISRVLETVKLTKKRDSLVSELSGGEKKRLSIATEYIADPVLFVLDEPDSGVDGSNARSIMSSLRNIADDNKIVFIISHSPDRTPELFDKVLVLAKSDEESCGKLAFYGSVEETLSFFNVNQLELVVSEVEATPDAYIKKYKDYRGD